MVSDCKLFFFSLGNISHPSSTLYKHARLSFSLFECVSILMQLCV